MQSKLSGIKTRIFIVFSSLILIGALLFPMWKIDLIAPQYPEGLTLKIYAYKLGGNVETVNGLNHYIGMKTLHEEEFIEFKVLPALLVFFSIFGVLVAIINRRKVLFAWMLMFIMFSAVSMADFYYWEYDYGHNLDPTAPIQVPGQAYQPPFLGYKQMLNFSAFSIPDTGGWFFIATGVLMFIISVMEWKKGRIRVPVKAGMAVLFVIFSALSISCTTGAKPILFGQDNCEFCKMTIVDKKFGAEILSIKGKVFKMDDLSCVKQFIASGGIKNSDIKDILVCDYNGQGELLSLRQSFMVKGEVIRGPMGGDIAVFGSKEKAENYLKTNMGEIIPLHAVFDLD